MPRGFGSKFAPFGFASVCYQRSAGRKATDVVQEMEHNVLIVRRRPRALLKSAWQQHHWNVQGAQHRSYFCCFAHFVRVGKVFSYFHCYVIQLLNGFYRIIEKNSGKAPLTYHQFQAIIASMDPPPQAKMTISEETIGNARTPIDYDHDEKCGVPTLEELGFETEGLKAPVWIGGETEALGKIYQLIFEVVN